MDAQLADAFEATWPAAEYRDAGGFRVGRGLGAGGRVSSARVIGPWSGDDVDAAVAIHQDWDQKPVFRVLDDDATLTTALAERGFSRKMPTLIMEIGLDALTDLSIPPVTTFAVWPPLAIQREIWAAGNIKAARQTVMERVPQPKAAILGRTEDRAAGAGFVAIHDRVAMVHGLEILSDWRRKGLASWMMRQAAFWAAENGANRLGLAVSRGNEGAVALYRHLGFREAAGYAYFEPG